MKIKSPFAIYKGLPKGIYIIFVSRIIDNMGSVVMPMITLILTQKIGLSKNETGILATVFMVSQAPFLLLGGKLVDKLGCKKVIVIFNTLGAVSYVPCIFLKPHIVMAVLIAFAADLFAVAAPAYNAIVTEVAAPKQMKSAYSILYLGYNLGLAIGPALGGILFNNYLQLLFLIDSLTCVASTTLVYFFVPDNSKIKREQPQQSQLMKKSELELNKSVYKFILHSPELVLFSIVLLLYNFCYSQWGFMLPLQAASIFKLDGAQCYSLLVSINAISVILLTPMLSTMTHKFQPLVIVAAGGIFYALSFLLFGGGKVIYAFAIAAVIMTMGQILVNINTNLYVAERTPQKYIGRANSMLTIINGVGVAIGPIIMGHVLLHLSFKIAWILVAALMLLGAAEMFMLNMKIHKTKKT